MAPKRYGSSGSHYTGGGSGSGGCPSFLYFSHASVIGLSIYIEDYINYVLFLFLFLCVVSSLFFLRKKPTQKRLTGWLFLGSMFFQILGWALIVLAVTLLECGVIGRNYYEFQIAFNLFFNLGNYLLLVTVVWGVNSLLVDRLGKGQSFVKAITLGISGLMGAATIALIGLVCYLSWVSTSAGRAKVRPFDTLDTVWGYFHYVVAYWALFLSSVIAAGGLAISTITRTRSRNILVGDILLWTVALFVCMVLWVIFQLVPFAANLDPRSELRPVTYTAITYLNNFFTLFSYICLIFISKSQAWEHANVQQTAYNIIGADAPAFVPAKEFSQQQYAYQGGGPFSTQGESGHQYYDPPQPTHHGVSGHTSGN